MEAASTKCNILHAYKLEDYDVEEWLTDLWQTKENNVFKVLIS